MPTSRIASMTRIALQLPEGDVRSAYINLMMREAAGFGGLQQYAVEQFLSGVLKKPIATIQKMMREKPFPDGGPKGKRKHIPAINRKLDGQPAPALLHALYELGGDWLKLNSIDELTRQRLWDYVAGIATRAMGGAFGDNIPGAAGIGGEDIAQVLGYGGVTWPGMIWDNHQKKNKERTENVYTEGQGVFYKAGLAAGAGKIKSVRALLGWLKTTTFRATRDFVAQVDAGIHAKFEYDQDGQMVVDSIGYEPSPIAEFLSAKRNLRRINKIMERDLKTAPGQLAVWKLVLQGMEAGKDLLKYKGGKGKDGNITVRAGKLREYALDVLKRQVGDLDMINPKTDKPYKDSVPSQQALQRNFDKIQKKMMAAAGEVLDTSQTSGDSPRERMRERDRDIRETIEDSIRPRRAGKTITASERSAMLRLAAALPVGSPERRAILAGCEKLPEGPMRDNCEKKKEEGASDKKAAESARHLVFSSKDKAKDFVKSLDKNEVRGKFSVRKTKGWKTYSVVFTPHSYADTVAIMKHYKPEKKHYEDIAKDVASKTAAGSPDPKGRNWKDKGGRWVWAGSDGDPAFTVVEKSAPFGSYYKLQMLLPDGGMYAAANQKSEKEDLFKRAAELYKAWGSAAGFDLSRQPERWSKMAGKGKLPEALKKNQFTSEDNPNPKGNDKDGDGKSNEPSPIKDKKASDKAALVRLAAALPVGSQERKTLLRMAAGDLKSALRPGLDRFTKSVMRLVAKELKGRGKHITDVKLEDSNTVRFKIRGKDGRISIFLVLSGSKPGIEVQYEGKKNWMKNKIPVNMDREASDFFSQAFYAIPSRLLD